MSLRLIAKDLYRLQQEVHRLREKLARCAPTEQDRLKFELKKAETRRNDIKRMLDGHLDR
jgi:hypothetical protein